MSLRIIVQLFAMIMGVLLCAGVIKMPQAGAQTEGGNLEKPPTNVTMSVPGYAGYSLGVIGVTAAGQFVYCHEWGIAEEWKFTSATQLPDTAQARAMGYLLPKYQPLHDSLTHAALAYLVHDHFELQSSRHLWDKAKDAVLKAIPGLSDKVKSLWEEGLANAVADTQVSVEYLQSKRRGQVLVRVVNAKGEAIENVPVTVELHGPAQFDTNSSTSITVMSKAGPVSLNWTATGDGEVSTSQSATVPTLDDMESAQNFVRLGESKQARYEGIRFSVKKTFQPQLSTAVDSRVHEAGKPTNDSLTVGVKTGEDWEGGVVLSVEGYLFTGLTHDRLTELSESSQAAVKNDETAVQYLKRLENLGLRVAGTSHVDVSGKDQTFEALAYDVGGSANPLLVDEEGKFASWVWVIDKAKQSPDAAQWIEHDAISGLLEVSESFSTRRHVIVDSTVTEHSAQVGAQLTDRITVSGFPDDHGKFLGNEKFGWKPDEKYATVSVYWSLNKPDKVQVPAEDNEHKLIGSWTYKAVNGVIAVGGGRPDAFGHEVRINAQKHGYYAFVYSFAGDDRVMPATSAWNDEWEYTRVIDAQEKTLITTHVSDESVEPGSNFNDIARVEGHVPEGSYVTFSAYDAVANNSQMGMGPELLHESRVAINDSMRQNDGSFIVTSPKVHTQVSGTVFWKATVWDASGQILASHGLGVEGEDTTIVPPPPIPPDKPQLSRTGADLNILPTVTVIMGIVAFLALALRAITMVIMDNKSGQHRSGSRNHVWGNRQGSSYSRGAMRSAQQNHPRHRKS
ncbi:hypothetical protein EJ419_06415 [Alloscardovia theropitheci]|uniref:Peptidase n=1 Tax=Alloscardovia theropitheci TaxID=2496842 RepID=A0A4R0QNU4_9BIFI|nr:hypothetical protein [Alloscardovia theropitheci]TCD53882.1 hypothetical protein EJ419_06415 [Alloscardovia theropitheci]